MSVHYKKSVSSKPRQLTRILYSCKKMKIVIFALLWLLSYCQGTEYYIRPTELANTSCPGQPCLTLSQYISDSHIFFKSNMALRFLPGLHIANETFEMQSLQNISLEGEQNGDYTLVVIDIHCSSLNCAGFRFLNINNLTVQSLNFSIHAQTLSSSVPSSELSSSGFMFTAVNHLSIYHTLVQFTSSDFIPNSRGITLFTSENILAHFLTVNNNGIYISCIHYATLSNTVVTHAQKDGIVLANSSYINIVNVTVSLSGLYGLDISYAHHIVFVNTSVTETYQIGFSVFASTHIALINTSVMYIFKMNDTYTIGFSFEDVTDAELHYVRILYSEDYGIAISRSFNITLEKVTLSNVDIGIYGWNNFNTHISYTTINSLNSAVTITDDQHCIISNTLIVFIQFQGFAVNVFRSHHVQIENISFLPVSQSAFLRKRLL